jgi:hypothetical protein
MKFESIPLDFSGEMAAPPEFATINGGRIN